MEEGKNQANSKGNADAAQIINTAQSIIGQAKGGASSATNEGGLENGVTDNFKGLSMRELIVGPLFAAGEAQEKFAGIASEYVVADL